MDVIQLAFQVKGVPLYAGEIVDVADYTNIKVLRDHNYTTPYAGSAYKCAVCKRMFVDEHILDVHMTVDHSVEASVVTSQDEVTGIDLQEPLTEAQAGSVTATDLIPGTNTTEPDGPASSPAVPEGSGVSLEK